MCILCGCVNAHVALSSWWLQNSSEETVGKGETGQPEQVGGLGRLCPACKLIDSLAKIPGPRCQGFQWGVCLEEREGVRDEWDMENLQPFHASSCWQLLKTGTSSVQCSHTEHWWPVGLISTRKLNWWVRIGCLSMLASSNLNRKLLLALTDLIIRKDSLESKNNWPKHKSDCDNWFYYLIHKK